MWYQGILHLWEGMHDSSMHASLGSWSSYKGWWISKLQRTALYPLQRVGWKDPACYKPCNCLQSHQGVIGGFIAAIQESAKKMYQSWRDGFCSGQMWLHKFSKNLEQGHNL